MPFNLKKHRRRSAVRVSSPPVIISTPIERTQRVQDLLAEAQVEVELVKAELERTNSSDDNRAR